MRKILLLLPALFMIIGTSACSTSGNASTEATPVMAAGSKELPTADMFKAAVDEAYSKFKGVTDGKNADYIPYLAHVDSKLFSIAIVTVNGDVYLAGDSDHAFPIQSVSKPFVLALAMQQSGADVIPVKIGVEPTGLPFNSVMAVELQNQKNNLPAGNPVGNAGAMTTVSLLKATSASDRWNQIVNYLSSLADDSSGKKLPLNEDVYKSEAATNQHNKGIAELLYSYGRLYSDPMEAVDVYTKQCSLDITAKQLAIIGATFANHGVNPFTKKTLINPEYVPKILSVMMMDGFYDGSGEWAWKTGLPSKTGVGGGIVSVVPGKYAIVAFSPKLDVNGNSVKAAKAIEYIANKLNASVFKA